MTIDETPPDSELTANLTRVFAASCLTLPGCKIYIYVYNRYVMVRDSDRLSIVAGHRQEAKTLAKCSNYVALTVLILLILALQ